MRPGRTRTAAFLLVSAIGIAVYLISTRVVTYGVSTGDIVGHLFQAEVFAMGKLYVPSPPFKDAFDTAAVVNDGKMYSRFEPGHSALLALGLLVFRSFKVTLAVLAALNAFLIFRIGLALWGDRTVALLALVVLLASPFFLFASSTELPHTSSLLWNAVFLLALIRAVDGDRWQYALLAGLAIGASLATRPLEAFGFALPGVLLIGWRAVGVWPRRRPPFVRPLGGWRRLAVLAAFAVGVVPFVAAILGYNRALTGDPLVFPRVVYNRAWGIEDQVTLSAIDSPGKFFHQYYTKHLYVVSVLADHLLSLGMGFQLLVALFILVARDRGSWLLIAIILILPLPFLMYNWYGDYYNTVQVGPRYLYSLLLPISLMSGKLLATLYRRLGHGRDGMGRWPVVIALIYFGLESSARADLRHWLAREQENTRWRAGLREQVLPPPGERALVFINCWQLGERDGMFWNHPSLQREVVFARHRGLKANLELQHTLFPDRTIFLGKIRVDPRSFILDWDVAGPFYAPFPQCLDEAWINESQASTVLLPAAKGWKHYQSDSPVLDFSQVFAGRSLENAVAYARALIHSDREQSVVLRYGSDDGIILWLNGEQLVREPVWRSADLDQGQVSARLRPGSNLLLIKVGQVWAAWQGVIRVTDASGNRPPGLIFSSPLGDRTGG